VVAKNTIVQTRVGIIVSTQVITATHFYANNIIIENDVGLEVDSFTSGHRPTWMSNLVFLNTTNYFGLVIRQG